MNFEWDANKADENESKHGVSFAQAVLVFNDPLAIEEAEYSSQDEKRFVRIGMANGQLLFVVFTERGNAIRIIHARKATKFMEKLYEKNQ